MRNIFTKLAAAAAIGTASLVAVPVANAADAPAASIQAAGDGTPAGAIQWYRNHLGSTAYQGLCEKAAENAYGTTGVWASANAHWNGASPKHTTGTPPAGSFVYWNISAYGHVGIADGNGGFYASSVGGAIGHGSSVSYFSNYRGWTPAAVPHQ